MLDFEGSPILSPPDDQLLADFRDEKDNEGDDATEQNAGIINWFNESNVCMLRCCFTYTFYF